MKRKLVLVVVGEAVGKSIPHGGSISVLLAPSVARLLCLLSEREVDLVNLRPLLSHEDLDLACRACCRAGVPYTLD